MGLPIKGHDEANDDLFSSGANPQMNPDNPQNARNFGGYGMQYNSPGDTTSGIARQSGADDYTQRYQGLAGQWMGMQAPQADYGQANGYLGQAGGYMGMSDQARQSQMDALGMERQAAMGQVPSVAQQQMQMGNADAMRGQLAMAASARGAGAMGAAHYNAGQNMGMMQSQNIAQSGMLRAQEMANARNAYMQGASGVRGQDFAGAGMAGNFANMTGSWAQNQAALRMQQQQLALQGQLGYERMGYDVQNAQLQANLQSRGMDEGHWQSQSGLDQHSTDRDTQNFWKGLGAVTGGAAGGMGAGI
jgi:hypothetical protein